MASFAIICEGVSENLSLHAIVEKFRTSDTYFSDIQPEMIVNHGHTIQNGSGGWTEVLSHCNTECFAEALKSNDYLIVQVDTDRCYETNFDIKPKDDEGQDKPYDVLYIEIINRILRDVDKNFYEENKDRIIFAICFNEIECWFLPVFFNGKKACSTTNCVYILNSGLQKEKPELRIPDVGKNNERAIGAYRYIFKKIKRKDISKIAKCNYGFDAFIKQLMIIPDDEEE